MALNIFYIWDSMVTWSVRAQEGVIELNPVISGLQQIDPFFYVTYRTGAFLLLNVLLWQIYVESPGCFERRWFKTLVAMGIAIYTVPLVMSFLLFL